MRKILDYFGMLFRADEKEFGFFLGRGRPSSSDVANDPVTIERIDGDEVSEH
ncbi:hypothetical protein [Tomitella biformata]|uniref:hypothetical protein n=1 Tax=Tomitella biformata TaxID=630403 RepID=UPI00130E6B67|nr:hypothetical protein [Tomitella biformata]